MIAAFLLIFLYISHLYQKFMYRSQPIISRCSFKIKVNITANHFYSFEIQVNITANHFYSFKIKVNTTANHFYSFKIKVNITANHFYSFKIKVNITANHFTSSGFLVSSRRGWRMQENNRQTL